MNNLDLLIPHEPPKSDLWTWATVEQATPDLRIRLDGDFDALPHAPENLHGDLQVNDRVWVQLAGHRVIVHGKAGGSIGVHDATPVGVMQMYLATVPPAGWLVANGGTFDGTIYPDLAALVGDTFGVHSGNLYFLPSMISRFPIGSELDPGVYGGSQYISVGNLPPHEHDMTHDHPTSDTSSAGSHSHTLDMTGPWDATNVGNYPRRGSKADYVVRTAGHGVNSSGAHTHSVDVLTSTRTTTGDGINLGLNNDPYYPPYLKVNFIIKADPIVTY